MITLEPPSTRAAAGGFSPSGTSLRLAALEQFLVSAKKAARLRGKVHVLLAGDATLRRLNREFRGKNKPTDVLSFPALAMEDIAPRAGKRTPPRLAGDLAISLETARRQADQFGHSLATEVRVLMLHGLLHLAGYDHETDTGQMAALEHSLRRTLRLPVGLIQRSEIPSAPAKIAKPAKKRPASRPTGARP